MSGITGKNGRVKEEWLGSRSRRDGRNPISTGPRPFTLFSVIRLFVWHDLSIKYFGICVDVLILSLQFPCFTRSTELKDDYTETPPPHSRPQDHNPISLPSPRPRPPSSWMQKSPYPWVLNSRVDVPTTVSEGLRPVPVSSESRWLHGLDVFLSYNPKSRLTRYSTFKEKVGWGWGEGLPTVGVVRGKTPFRK